jgi:hypothetical protein
VEVGRLKSEALQGERGWWFRPAGDSDEGTKWWILHLLWKLSGKKEKMLGVGIREEYLPSLQLS